MSTWQPWLSGAPASERVRVGAAGGQLVAWCALAVVNATMIAILVPLPVAGLGVRALHHFFDAGQLVGVGFLVWAAVVVWERFGPRRPGVRLAAIAAVACGLAAALVAPDLLGAARAFAGEEASPTPFLLGMIAGTGAGIAACAAAGAWLARRGRLAAAGALLGIAGAVANHLVLVADYPGVHLAIAAAAATLLGASVASLPLPRLAQTRWARAARAGLATAGTVALVVPPSNTVAVEIFLVPGAVIAPALVRLRTQDDDPAAAVDRGEWFADRAAAADVPPSSPPVTPHHPIVIMMVVDALRSDVVFDPKNAAAAPEMQALRRESVAFTEARAPSTSTITSLASFFAGRYYSGLYWTKRDGGGRVYPHEDPTPRFPELLASAGFATVTFTGKTDVANAYGIVRGIQEEHVMKAGRSMPPASMLMDAVLDRVASQGPGGLFLYTHFTDAHVPYNLAGTEGTLFERYLREVTLVDDQLRRLRALLAEPRLAARTVLILTADHGEAFGEHGSYSHGPFMYEELLRVPLLIKAPRVAPREVTRPVTLLDIGPTVLDLAHRTTPRTFLGQSLVPFLRGEDPVLTRPIAAESQRRVEAMVFEDRWKVIRDARHATYELYDLESDPGERRNLFDERPEEARARLGAMRAFFGAHTPKRDWYEVPYMP